MGWRRLRGNGTFGVDAVVVTLAFSAFLIRRQRAAGFASPKPRWLQTEKGSPLQAFAPWSGSPRLTSVDSEVIGSLFLFL